MAPLLPKKSYTYTPLDPTKQEIRLITLHPSPSLDDPVTITLSTVSLQKDPSYEAISYVWGDPKITASVTIGGVSVQVTTNLETALRYFRLDSEIRILWADAICINQQDVLEKKLSEDNEEDGKETFEMLETLAAGIDFPFADPFLDCKDLLKHPRTKFMCLSNIMQRSYFSRIWVAQETILPGRVEYRCGRSIIDRKVWIEARWPLSILAQVRKVKSCGTCNDAPGRFLFEAASTLSDKSSPSKYQPLDLAYILYRTRLLLCANPLDKVFAVLAFMRPADQSCFTIDYTNTSVNRLSADVINVEAMQYKTLSMLGISDLVIFEGKSSSPSWWPFPQWNLDPQLVLQYESGPPQEHKLLQDTVFKACGSSEALLDLNLVEEGVLGVSSILVDTIESTQTMEDLETQSLSVLSMEQAAPRIDLHGEQDFMRGSQNGLKHAPSMEQGLPPRLYVGGGTIGNAWWRTLVSDSIILKNWNVRRVQELDEHIFGDVWTTLITTPAGHQVASFKEDPENRLMSGLARTTQKPSIVTTQKLYYGTAPLIARVGDEVHIIGGSNWPLLLRKVDDATATLPATYLCLGKCYLHGIMDGEAAENFADRATRINLV